MADELRQDMFVMWTASAFDMSFLVHYPKVQASAALPAARIVRMPYPEMMVAPMREDLVRIGFTELKTTDDVDDDPRHGERARRFSR